MPVLMSVVGALAAVVGFVVVGVGILTGDLALAGMLITAGMTALMGGLILAGLGAVVAELRRVSQALSGRPVVRPIVAASASDAAVAGARPEQTDRIPFPVRQKRAGEQGEPRLADPQANGGAPGTTNRAAAQPPPPDRLRRSFPSLTRPDVMGSTGDVSGGAASAHAKGPLAESVASHDAGEKPAAAPDGGMPATAEPAGVPTHASEQALPLSRSETFDALWPPASRSNKELPLAAKPQSQAPAAAAVPATGSAAMSDLRGAEAGSAEVPAGQTAPVSIVKSGVVDGMAYTLYSDGSIEAQLAQGTIRFRSLNELRMHLENAA
jgi:hypothetical protein